MMPTSIGDVDCVERILVEAALARRTLTYAEMLAALGHGFTRPRMRALCRTLDAIDARRAIGGCAALAVLVVRQSDRLPGQGWWIARPDYSGRWIGPEAAAHVAGLQANAFDACSRET